MRRLTAFPCLQGRFNILLKIGSHYDTLCYHLLGDSGGERLEEMEMSHQSKQRRIVREIMTTWMKEHREHTWERLVHVLRRCELVTLADDIERVLNCS